jgi:hypothetical protein
MRKKIPKRDFAVLLKYIDNIDLHRLIVNYKLSLDQIDLIKSKMSFLCWATLCSIQPISRKFLIRFKNNIIWSEVSKRPLKEELMREFLDYLSWNSLVRFQKLSEAFLVEFIDNYEINYLKYNKKIPVKLKERIIAMKELM